MEQCKVAVVGSFNVDITGYSKRLPKNGETVIGSSYQMSAGGKGSNQATAAARSGAEVVFIAKIGTDALSSVAHQHFEREGIDLTYIKEENLNTGCALIEVDEITGENRIIAIQGANACVGRDDVYSAETAISQCPVCLTQLETDIESVRALTELSRKYHSVMIVNPAPYAPIPPDLYRDIDIFTPNETEAEYYSGIRIQNMEDVEKAANIILSKGVKTVVITLGSMGVFYKNEFEKGMIHSVKVKAVDTTGAGDAFSGALAYALSKGETLRNALEYANHYAALSVTKKGAADSMPTNAEVGAFLKNLVTKNQKSNQNTLRKVLRE